MGACTSTLRLVHDGNESVDGTAQIRRIKPYRCEENNSVDNNLQDPAEEGIATHAMQHLIVLAREVEYFLQHLCIVGIHRHKYTIRERVGSEFNRQTLNATTGGGRVWIFDFL